MKKILCLCWFFISIVYETRAGVYNDFSNCFQYFYKAQIPKGLESIASPSHFDLSDLPDGIQNPADVASPAYICQMSKGKSYFATLYDRGRRIPLYSAYILDKRDNVPSECGRQGFFTLEPQLVYRNINGDTLPIKDTKSEIKNYNTKHGISERPEKNRPSVLIETSQAVDSDYKSEHYQRGHLNPCGHHVAEVNYKTTFTLTNVVPMTNKLNNDIWSKYEDSMVKYSDGCTTMYVIIGIVPGNNVLNNRLTIPSYVWNAYCCVDNNGQPIKSGAALIANDNAFEPNYEVKNIEISVLQVKLKGLLGVPHNIVLFQNDCKR
ncbi:endonuclease domain-containing 1 protein-like [Mixophyes fleayi]|uniref:endonuclease domain-containing 1 protein-like n=1 Tax=Mixophyes fleayi TaxID=3061075 RepID=UPI003F4DD39B